MRRERDARSEVSAAAHGRRAARGTLENREFVPLIALLMSLVALSIDAMLPALPVIGNELGAAERNDAQLVVTALFLGLGAGQLLYGPLSDCIGRKPAICAGLGVFMAGCLVSVFAPTFETMLAGRVLQGIGVAGPRIVTMALVRDQYEGRQMARIMSFVMSVFIIVPAIAPALGQGILWIADWRAIFVTFFAIAAIACAWLVIRQPETLLPERRLPFSLRALGGSAWEVVTTRTAMGYTLATGFAFSPFVAYLSAAQQIFQDAYGVGALFPVYFGGLALAFGTASLANGYLVMRYGMHRLSVIAGLFVAFVSFVSWVGIFPFDGLPPLWLFVGSLMLIFAAVALLFGNLNALAMQPLGHVAGIGAAIIAALSTLISVPFGAYIAHRFDGTLYTLMGAFAVFGLAIFVAMQWAVRGGKAPVRS